MPIPTAFHPRTALLNQRQEWRDWSGYLTAGVYENYHEREYFAIRNSAALIDVSPLFKYEVSGPGALQLLNRVMTRDIRRCQVGGVMYSPWCDDDGKVIDDGTIARLAEDRFRVTSADPSLRWFQDCGYGLEAEVRDVSAGLAALALQGPKSRAILETIVRGADVKALKYFGLVEATVAGFPLIITRTGYTGDLGYELWVNPEHALTLWDCLLDAGAGYGIMPAGIAALDIARIEAGLLLIEVDYISASKAFIEEQKSSPHEIGLGWAVQLTEGNDFVGRAALEAERLRNPAWCFVGLEVDWVSLEGIFGEVDLPPQVTGRASRSPAPLYQGFQQIGQVTSSTFSPVLKKFIALGTVRPGFAAAGTEVEMEVTVEYSRKRAQATVVTLPFLDLARKRE